MLPHWELEHQHRSLGEEWTLIQFIAGMFSMHSPFHPSDVPKANIGPTSSWSFRVGTT